MTTRRSFIKTLAAIPSALSRCSTRIEDEIEKQSALHQQTFRFV